MEIIYYCPTFYPENSGYSNAFAAYLKALSSDSQLQINVITPKKLSNHNELDLGPNVSINRKYFSDRFNLFLPGFIRTILDSIISARYVNILSKDKKKIIFVETFEDVFFLMWLRKKIFKRTIIRIHAATETECFYFFKGIYFKIGRFLINNVISKKVVNVASTNQYHIDFAKTYYFRNNVEVISAKRFFVLPNTLSTNILINSENTNGGTRLIKVCTLGRMNKVGFLQKGFDDIMSLLLLLKDTLEKVNVEYTIIGSGEYDYKFKNLIKKENFKNVKLLQNISNEETISLLLDSDIVVLPSRFEGMSMFALESLATGNLLLFSNTGGLSDLVDDGINGYKFEPQNLEAFSNAFIKSISIDKAQLSKMKSESHKKYYNQFSPGYIRDKSKKIFKIIENSYENE